MDGAQWDLVLQAGHQSQAHRLKTFFDDSEFRNVVFPGRYFARSAEQLGPRTEHIGPCSVLFKGLGEGDVAHEGREADACVVNAHGTGNHIQLRRADALCRSRMVWHVPPEAPCHPDLLATFMWARGLHRQLELRGAIYSSSC